MKRIAIVGGGVIGQCCALELAKLGHQVTICDANLGQGCSYGNGGIIVPSHFVPIASPGMLKAGLRMALNPRSPFGLVWPPSLATLSWMGKFLANATSANVARSSDLIKNLNLASRQLYTQLAHELDHDFGLDQKGLIMLCRTKEGFHEEQQLGQTARTLGLSIADCSKEVLRQMEPGAEISAVGAVHFKDDAHLNPRAFMAAITERLEQLNVCFVKEDAVSFTAGTNRISSMRTSSKTVEADEFVIAVGAWTQQLAGQIGQNLPMVSGRGYGFTLPPEKLKLLHPAILVESRIAVTPTSEGIRFVGCLELGAPSTRPYAKRLEAMKDAIPCYYPGVNRSDLDTLEIWTGHRPCTPDGLPYIGRSKKIENLVWASGHAMMGLSLGPITGSLVSQIVEGHSPDFPMSLLSPERYAS